MSIEKIHLEFEFEQLYFKIEITKSTLLYIIRTIVSIIGVR